MQVAFIFLHPLDSSLGSIVRLRELATHLVGYGAESRIFTPYANTQTLNQGVQVISVGGISQKIGLANQLYRFTKFAYYNPFLIRHILLSQRLQLQFAKKSAKRIINFLKQEPMDVIIVEQDFAIPTGIEVKKQTGLPLVADIHNLTSEELVASGAIKRYSAEFKKLQTTLKNNLRQVDEVVVVSDLMRDYVIENYAFSSEHVHVVPPGGSSGQKIEKYTSIDPKVVYSGLVAYREHVDLFVKSMPYVKLQVPNAEFYITDKGEGVAEIKKLARQLHVNPVFFYYPKKVDFLEFLRSCAVAVLPSSNDKARRMGTPVKLFDYLSAGLPVVANNVAAWDKIIQENSVGIVTEDDPMAFADGIVKLLKNHQLRMHFSDNARSLASTYSWDDSARKLKQVLNSIVL